MDYGVFGGPFNGKVKYPITKDSLTDNPWLANIDKALLDKYIGQVKTGLPGIAYVRTDPRLDWPANLAVKLPP